MKSKDRSDLIQRKHNLMAGEAINVLLYGTAKEQYEDGKEVAFDSANKLAFDNIMENVSHYSKVKVMGDGGKINVSDEMVGEYKLGMMWKDDFPYEDMLQTAIRADLNWGADNLSSLFDSFEDVNYHTASRPLWQVVLKLREDSKDKNHYARYDMNEFHDLVEKELDEIDAPTLDSDKKPADEKVRIVTSDFEHQNNIERLDDLKKTQAGYKKDMAEDYIEEGHGRTKVQILSDFDDEIKRYQDLVDNAQIEDEIKGGEADGLTTEDIAKKHGVTADYIKKQLAKGTLVESEHTNDPKKAREISMDHLSESANYYVELGKMENKLEDDKKHYEGWQLTKDEFLGCVILSKSQDGYSIFDCYGNKYENGSNQEYKSVIADDDYLMNLHKKLITDAVSEKLDVPDYVFKDYPELKQEHQLNKLNKELTTTKSELKQELEDGKKELLSLKKEKEQRQLEQRIAKDLEKRKEIEADMETEKQRLIELEKEDETKATQKTMNDLQKQKAMALKLKGDAIKIRMKMKVKKPKKVKKTIKRKSIKK